MLDSSSNREVGTIARSAVRLREATSAERLEDVGRHPVSDDSVFSARHPDRSFAEGDPPIQLQDARSAFLRPAREAAEQTPPRSPDDGEPAARDSQTRRSPAGDDSLPEGLPSAASDHAASPSVRSRSATTAKPTLAEFSRALPFLVKKSTPVRRPALAGDAEGSANTPRPSEFEEKITAQIAELSAELRRLLTEVEGRNVSRGLRVRLSQALAMARRAFNRRRSYGKPSPADPLFDEEYYLSRYEDVARSGVDAYTHFLQFGVREGRNPNALFDTRWYLTVYEDVRAVGVNPLTHYVQYGATEGRNPGPNFDGRWYLQRYPDVEKSQINPLLHYLRHGLKEGRETRPVGQIGREDDAARSLAAKASGKRREGDEPSRPLRARGEPDERLIIRFLDRLAEGVARLGPVDAVILLPLLGRGGSEKVAMSYARALREARPDRSTLILTTDLNVLDEQVPIAEGAFVINLLDFVPASEEDRQIEFLFQVLRTLAPRLCHIINSSAGWKTLRRFGDLLEGFIDFYGCMFCLQRDRKTNDLVGYAAEYFDVAARYCRSMLSDNATFLRELGALFPDAARALPMRAVYIPITWKPLRALVAAPSTSAASARSAVLWAGRLDEQKRVAVLFETAARLPDFDFYVFGSKVTDGAVDLRRLPNVFYEGSFLTAEELVGRRRYTAYMHTTYEEGLPNIIVELGEHHMPVVAPAVGGIPEIVSGETGWLLTSAPDGQEYAAALREIVAHPAEASRRAAALRDLVRVRHGWSSFTDNLRSVSGYLGSHQDEKATSR
jgi:glycosyltransferase involved in cell wall biosynthesis